MSYWLGSLGCSVTKKVPLAPSLLWRRKISSAAVRRRPCPGTGHGRPQGIDYSLSRSVSSFVMELFQPIV